MVSLLMICAGLGMGMGHYIADWVGIECAKGYLKKQIGFQVALLANPYAIRPGWLAVPHCLCYLPLAAGYRKRVAWSIFCLAQPLCTAALPAEGSNLRTSSVSANVAAITGSVVPSGGCHCSIRR